MVCVTLAAQAIVFKMAAKEGANIFDYQVFRGLSVLILAVIVLGFKRLNPFDVEKSQGILLNYRALIANLAFVFLNLAIPLIPVSFAMIIFQTYPLWIGILSFAVNGEMVSISEIIGLIVCFCAIFVFIYSN